MTLIEELRTEVVSDEFKFVKHAVDKSVSREFYVKEIHDIMTVEKTIVGNPTINPNRVV